MTRAFVLITSLCIYCSCTKKSYSSIPPSPEPSNPSTLTTTPPDTSKTYLALGDSYTIGQSVALTDCFPVQVVDLLRLSGIKIADPVIIAHTGWTTLNLQQAIATASLQPNYDAISLLIGVNDQYQHVDTSVYVVRFTQLLQTSIQLAKGRAANVFVLSIPDYSATPFVPQYDKARVKMEVDWFNAINKRITLAYNVSYSDITPASRQAAFNPSLIAADSLHPSGLQYKVWADSLAPKMQSVLH